MDFITRFDRSLEEDYYALLGCHESSTVDQILVEYKHKALLYHPDKNPDDKTLVHKFQKLQEAKEILTDPAKRKDYDQWRSAGIAIPYKQWVSMRRNTSVVFHWAIAKPDEGRMLEMGQHQSPHPASPPETCQQHRERMSRMHAAFHQPNELLRKFRNYEI